MLLFTDTPLVAKVLDPKLKKGEEKKKEKKTEHAPDDDLGHTCLPEEEEKERQKEKAKDAVPDTRAPDALNLQGQVASAGSTCSNQQRWYTALQMWMRSMACDAVTGLRSTYGMMECMMQNMLHLLQPQNPPTPEDALV